MLGAVIGDIIGSYYSENPTFSSDPPLINDGADFTQNTMLAAGLCGFLSYSPKEPCGWIERRLYSREVAGIFKKNALHFPEKLERSVKTWAEHGSMIRSSVGSASAAIITLPYAYACGSYESAAQLSELACSYIYNTDSSKAAAKALVTAVFLLAHGADNEQTAAICKSVSGIDVFAEGISLSEQKERLLTDSSPEAVIKTAFSVFFSSKNFSDALRKSCSCGEFSHIISAAAGAMSQAQGKKIPERLKAFALEKLDIRHKKQLEIFLEKYPLISNS
ncbi:MAG: hypothetical protein ACI4JW_11945 [Oscillospiraceae bacterium]